MTSQTQIKELTQKLKAVLEIYKTKYPEVKMDRDYFPLKISEEWGECLQMYLTRTGRGREKDRSKEKLDKMFADECADVFGNILLFADQENIDLVKALENKWFSYLEQK